MAHQNLLLFTYSGQSRGGGAKESVQEGGRESGCMEGREEEIKKGRCKEVEREERVEKLLAFTPDNLVGGFSQEGKA